MTDECDIQKLAEPVNSYHKNYHIHFANLVAMCSYYTANK